MDSFTYQASDGALTSSNVAVAITINAMNDPPDAANQSIATTAGTPLPITLDATDIDLDPLLYTLGAPPAHGSLSGTAPNIIYTPAANYTGDDSFTFMVNDGQTDSDLATVSITVNAPAPNLTAISPTAAVAGDPSLTLIVTGTGFVAGSSVRWNGSDRPTTFINNTRLSVNIPAADLLAVGTASVTVSSPTPGGGTSAPQTFAVVANRLANGRFELDSNADTRPDSWTSSARFTRSTAAVHGGSYSGRHFATNNPTYNIQQLVSGLSGNTPYVFSGWTNIPATSDTFTYRLRILWRSAAGATLRNDTVKTYTAATGGAWDHAMASLVAPVGTASAYVRMEVTSLNATIYADDFTLR
jgi:hypothetical protein